jgi:hypothetical protein
MNADAGLVVGQVRELVERSRIDVAEFCFHCDAAAR